MPPAAAEKNLDYRDKERSMHPDLTVWRVQMAQTVREGWCRWRARRAAAAELAALDATELGRIAGEFGLSAGELRAVAATGPEAAALLDKRLGALGIEPTDAALLEVKRDLERCCSLCDSKRECARDLQADPQSPAWTQYCPNKAALSALVALKAPTNVEIGLRQ
jgi:hypothetical protein